MASATRPSESVRGRFVLPLVYHELRKRAAQRLSREKPGQTLQATALVHGAYLRLVESEKARQWNSRGHFFDGAAAQRASARSRRRAIGVYDGSAADRRGSVPTPLASDRIDLACSAVDFRCCRPSA